jgi:glycosyltransferase involved in cell wall biosynthesis
MTAVVIDAQRLRTIHCGLGQFCLHLCQAVLEADDSDIEPVLLARPQDQAYFSGRRVRFLAPTDWQREPVASLVRPYVTAFRRHRGYDLWHTTHQDSKHLPLDASVPLVLTIHDLSFLRQKSPVTIRRRLRTLQAKVNRATVITTASHHAAHEISEHINLQGKSIEVIPHGVCIKADERVDRRPSFLPPGRFLFSISDITVKKNFHVLVALAAKLPEYRIVIAGNKRDPYADEIQRQVQAANLVDRVLLPGVVTDQDRQWLYQNCDAFLFPSLSEGFGLPVIEAMACGQPVFVSDLTSLPEVGGTLAFYWRDFDPAEMERVFRAGMRAAEAPGYATSLREHAATFSWSRAAEQYLTLYKRTLAATAMRSVTHQPRGASTLPQLGLRRGA